MRVRSRSVRFAIVELTFFESLPNDALHQLLDGLARMVAGRRAGRFGRVRQHRIAASRDAAAARVGKQRRIDRIGGSARKPADRRS